MSYKRILLPVSGKFAGDRACKALKHAKNLLDSGEIVALHVYAPLSQRVGGEAHSDLAHEAVAEGMNILGPVLREIENAGIACRGCVVEGTPAMGIVKAAHTEECDLIVMFTDGHDSITDILLGGVTERVLRNTDVPLLAVRK